MPDSTTLLRSPVFRRPSPVPFRRRARRSGGGERERRQMLSHSALLNPVHSRRREQQSGRRLLAPYDAIARNELSRVRDGRIYIGVASSMSIIGMSSRIG